VFAAWDHPLNLFITINIDDAFVTRRPQSFIYRFLHRASDWLRYHGVGAYYAWVLENNEVVGIHCHILMHWPWHLQTGLDTQLRKWLRLSGGEYHKGVLQWSDTNGDEGVGVRFSNSAVARYLLKGADPVFCRHWGLDHKPQGKITGKRLGVSRSLDVSARSQTWEGRLKFPLAVPWSKTEQIPHFILGFYRSRDRDRLCDETPNSGCALHDPAQSIRQ
jgi:hypothetical protein